MNRPTETEEPASFPAEPQTVGSYPGHRRARFGPGLIVAAAFIGPGTVVTASRAGASYGCELLWTIVFASVAAMILQSFAAQLGILAGQGLGESIRYRLQGSHYLKLVVALVVIALGVGNAAYQTGNLAGAASGLSSIMGGSQLAWLIGLSIVTASILYVGEYRWLQRILIGLVCLLSLSFLVTAALCLPAPSRILSGALVPRVSAGSLTLVIALIGTTIVPYNLFLHSSAAAENWRGMPTSKAWKQACWDTVLSIGLGGLVTASIVVTASAAFFDQGLTINGIGEMAGQLGPTLGSLSTVLFGLGLFSAGLTSSITAPLATAYALCGVLGWRADNPRSGQFRGVSLLIVAVGATFAIVNQAAPSSTILLAQVANGLLLPIMAGLLVWIMARTFQERGDRRSKHWQLYAGYTVVACVTLLAGWKIIQACWPT